jgi:ABC-type uncharacterized transport system ATPase subunit
MARSRPPSRAHFSSVSPQPVLAVSELARQYGELKALRELELALGEGECVAVIGHNGSGKTTAVRIIAGLLDPSAGSVLIDGAQVGPGPDGVIARGALGMVPDTPCLYDDLTVRDHLQLVAIAHGAVDKTLDAQIDSLLAAVGGPIAILGHAVAHQRSLLGAGVAAFGITSAAAMALLAAARRATRDD